MISLKKIYKKMRFYRLTSVARFNAWNVRLIGIKIYDLPASSDNGIVLLTLSINGDEIISEPRCFNGSCLSLDILPICGEGTVEAFLKFPIEGRYDVCFILEDLFDGPLGLNGGPHEVCEIRIGPASVIEKILGMFWRR